MRNIYIIILIFILIINFLNNSFRSYNNNSGTIGNQYNSPIQNQTNNNINNSVNNINNSVNNIIYVNGNEGSERKYGNSPYSKYLLFPDLKYKQSKTGLGSFGRSNSYSRFR
jgi:hypothetical protein